MTTALYSMTIPLSLHLLGVIDGILRKGEAYAVAKKIDPSVLLNARLFPDMFPLTKQIQILSDTAKGAAGRLAGLEVPRFEDNESTFGELYTRVQKTRDFLLSLSPEAMEGAENRQIQFKVAGREMSFSGSNYVTAWVLPNLYFHATTAYNILRHNGVELGKRDFLGEIQP
jgi:uncharacterized protein